MEQVKGFKAFNADMTNLYGQPFKENEIYRIPSDKKLTAGTKGTGIHFTLHLEDAFHYFEAIQQPVKVARVSALGKVVTFNDPFEYYGFYDICATDTLRIDHIMTREEILTHMLTTPGANLLTFIRDYKLENNETEQILTRFPNNINISLAIDYYQRNDKDTYYKFYGVKR